MSRLSSEAFGKQLKRPEGEDGIYVAQTMNTSNEALYNQALEMISFNNHNKILEIGFGNGRFIEAFYKINPTLKVYGLDYSETMCEQARVINKEYIENAQLTIKCEDALKMSLDENYIDIVITLNTVYFWTPFEEQINEIKRVLKPKGQLLIGYRPKIYLAQMHYTKEGFTFYDPEDLKQQLSIHGFSVIGETNIERERTIYDGTKIKSIDACILAEYN